MLRAQAYIVAVLAITASLAIVALWDRSYRTPRPTDGRTFDLAAAARENIARQWAADDDGSPKDGDWERFEKDQISLTLSREEWAGLLRERDQIWLRVDIAFRSPYRLIGLVLGFITLSLSLLLLFLIWMSRPPVRV